MPPLATPPLVCTPLAIPRPWGGHRAGAVADIPPPPSGARIGEWWLLSTRAAHPSTIRGGPFDGRTLRSVLEEVGPGVLGRRHAARWATRFPVLLKILDAEEPLSIQVHPSERDVPDEGKTETWYVLDPRPDASFFLGLADGIATRDFFARVRRGDDPEPLLRRHAARPGTIAHLPAGVIHALGAGIVALEIQTSADTTYRIFDWRREPPRELHLDRAELVATADQRPELLTPRPLPPAMPPRELLVDCPAYRVERLRLAAPTHLATDGERFEVLLPLGGALRVAGDFGSAEVPRGHAVLVPAATADFLVSPAAPLELLRVVPGSEGSS